MNQELSHLYPSIDDLLETLKKKQKVELDLLLSHADTHTKLSSFLSKKTLSNELVYNFAIPYISISITALPSNQLSDFTSFLSDLSKLFDRTAPFTLSRQSSRLANTFSVSKKDKPLYLTLAINLPNCGIRDLYLVPERRTYEETHWRVMDRPLLPPDWETSLSQKDQDFATSNEVPF